MRTGHLKSEKGQAAVELALVLPLALVLLLAVVDFGAAFNYRNDVTHLANQAARYAAVSNCGTGCVSLVNSIKASADTSGLKNGSGSNTGTDQALVVCIDFPSGSTGLKGQPVRATVETKYQFLPLLKLTKTRIYAQATVRLESDYTATGGSPSPYTPSVLDGAGNCPGYVP
jgi:Flp pilus assembly protein TadG